LGCKLRSKEETVSKDTLSPVESLLKKVRLAEYKKGSPKRVLYEILDEIERIKYYGYRRDWEIMVELLARWTVLNLDLKLSSMGPIKAFEGLQNSYPELYQHIEKEDLFQAYYMAAKQDPWDHLGDVFTETGISNDRLGQALTPKPIVDMMTEMTIPEEVKEVQTIMDPAVGTGRFLLEASRLRPKAPLILFGVEIDLYLYRACLVNMAMFSNHPYSIICGNTLRLDPEKSGPASPIWDLGNQWLPPDITPFYWKPMSPFQAYMKTKQGKE
jgi:hypothetical protein